MQESFRSLPHTLRRRFLYLLWLAYAGTAIWALPHSHPAVVAGLIAIFSAAGLVKPVPNPLGGITDASSGLMITAALLWQPQDVLLGVGIGSFIGLLLFRRNEVWRACMNGAGWGLPAAAAAAMAPAATSVMMPSLISLIIAGAVAVAVFRFINTGIFAVYRSQRFGRRFLSDWRQSLTYQWSSNLLSAPLAIALAAVGRIGNMWSGLSLTAAYALILPIVRQEYAYYNRSREMLDETVEAVVRALEGADPAARAHGDRVSALAVETGRRMRMSERELMALRLASRLHDVGLLAGPDRPDMEQHHAVTGGRVLTQFPDPLIGEFVRAHHERWDGEGIPDHLQGRAIPLGARILAAAEIYDSAQTGLSPFEKPLTREEASRYLTGLAGTALDPQAVAALLSVAAEQDQHPTAAR